MENSTPTIRLHHLPYVSEEERQTLDIETCKKISTARCARVSYLTHDGQKPSVEKDIKLHDMLVAARPIHASPTEHQATAVYNEDFIKNFAGWSQYRVEVEKLIYKK
jgi:hypothetical protein